MLADHTDTIAALDLGSNSFHMIVARISNGQIQVLDRLREMVQLAAGLDQRNRLSSAAQQRALACLERFGQRLQQIQAGRLRIVGTNTLRQARNSAGFLRRAQQVLGHSVDIISGAEEARLIYLGVVHSVAAINGQRLVIDIGGGSSELIIGQQFNPLYLHSLKMGCISINRAHFSTGTFSKKQFQEAELQVQRRIEPIREEYLTRGWQVVTGASGTIKVIQNVLEREGWSEAGISLQGLRRLRSAILEAGNVAALIARWQLEEGRAQVFAGGFVVLHGLCEALHISRLDVSDGALREGVLYDLLGRIRDEDVRDHTIAAVSASYGIDAAQAQRVSNTARQLLEQAKEHWGLQGEEAANWLEWAARLHEIGLLLSYERYHKHGAYIIQHANFPGFSRCDQMLLALLVRRHRRAFPADAFKELRPELAVPAQRLCVLLRLAVLLHRGRSRQALPPLIIKVRRQRLIVQFPAGWLDTQPLTRADLEAEREYLKEAGLRLAFC